MEYSKRKISSVNLHNSTRYFILALSTIVLTLIVCNSIALNFTIICMTNENIGSDSNNLTISKYDYSPIARGWLFSIISVGNILGTLTLPYLITKFELRKIMTIYGLISACSTLSTPFSAYIGYTTLLFMRFLQGFATSMCFSSMGSITSQWSSIKESGFFMAMLSTHFQLGSTFTMPIAGELCESRWGWPSLYYFQGTLTAILSILFYVFYRDDPFWHGFVSDKELTKIEKGKISVVEREINIGKNKKKAATKVPYKEIFTDYVVWGTVIGMVFLRSGFLLFVQFGPVYLNKVMKFDIKMTGISSSLPYVGLIILKIIFGTLSDKVTCIPMSWNLKIFVAISGIFLVVGNLCISYITVEYAFFAQVAFIVIISFTGVSFVGTMKCAQLISQHYSHIIMAFITIGSSIVSIILPMIVAVVAPDNTQAQWKTIFIGISIVIFVGMSIFIWLAEVEPRAWVKNFVNKNKVYTISKNEFNVISLPNEEKKKIDTI